MDSQQEMFDYFLPFKLVSKSFGKLKIQRWFYRAYGIFFRLIVIESLWILQIVYLFTMADNVKDISFVLGGLVTYTAIASKTLFFVHRLP